MFGRHIRPLDLMLGTTQPRGAQTVTNPNPEWVSQHHERLQYAYQKVSENLWAAADKNKRLYDRTTRDAPLLPGERVLVQDSRRQGKGKLSNRWDPQPYVIIHRHGPDLPVYTLRPEGKSGPERVLHRNLLRPCPHYPAGRTEREQPQAMPCGPQTGWAWVPVLPPGGDNQGPAPRGSQRVTRPPERYGNWAS